jgi:indole-3-glycerol phosphate synthase
MKTQKTLINILKHQKVFLDKKMDDIPIKTLKEMVEDAKSSNHFDMILNKNKKDDLALICEFKPGSPSKGRISSFNISDMVNIYQNNGASMISVLTEETFFHSNIENLKVASSESKIPLLRKDFLINEYQVYESKAAGASSVLLIYGVYPNLEEGITLCRNLEMEPLIECHNRNEIREAVNAGAQMIGVNNRNLNDFTIDLDKTKQLAAEVPENLFLVSESGIQQPNDIKLLASTGADAVLVGTCLMGCETFEQVSRTVKDLKKSCIGVRQQR